MPNFPTPFPPEPPADVSFLARGDVMWDRPIFKAPPLSVKPLPFDATIFASDLRRADLVAR